MTESVSQIADREAARGSSVWAEPSLRAGFAAILLGGFLVLGVGFAGSDVIHNATHDGRHSMAFPCH